ncbi:MAG: esterase/lipase family protein [Acidothermaceae bacterium]
MNLSPRRRQTVLVWLVAMIVVAVAVVATVLLTDHSSGRTAQGAPTGSPSSPAGASTNPGSVASGPGLASPSPSASLAAPAPSASVSIPPRPPEDQPGPVILVPGYGGDASMLDNLAILLRKHGRTTVTLALPDDATGDFHGQEQVLAAQVNKSLASGTKSVDLVGYSAGGIVVGLFVAADPSVVRRVVTIGSPLHGTRLAGLAAGILPSACPIACEQMVPGSALLASLTAASPTVTGVPWLSMWTSTDQVVTPPDSARFAGATNVELQSVCADDQATHITLPTDPLAEALTLQALGGSGLPLKSPSAAECTSLRALG